ncbi:TetR/AcrR family transcriptional regulator [Micromonospora sp. PPF5-17]|uniref:TetR/AcrR family transcriptional regulator n=2 Tax=Micromonosporaceae TaxID=28056 RepID=A0ABX9WG02_9ACTN|nr:TetR/AcrR family transcriptional regulator [Micromonospora sp. PPF5-17B]NES37042.1 TetR/AcrR family transcriptional regulator [Micromonospora solifontis]NES55567.1 TetR/AcrR family transcriptional regulator [Micromonospora sp. PPF5-6]RNL98842.1 TetR/AcrR family transcriptional regulator [Micromonospora solifontis]
MIVAAAGALADAGGLDAVTLRGVAARLDVLPMRLYRHLDSWDDLLDLLADAACGEIELPDPPSGDWRDRLRALAAATVAVARRHPWYVPLLGSRPPYGPNGLAYQEWLFAALDRPGLAPDTLMHAANAFLGYLVGQLHLELLRVPAGATAHVPPEEQLRYLARAVGDGRHPALARLFAQGRQLDAVEAFDAGLEIVLDGIAGKLG